MRPATTLCACWLAWCAGHQTYQTNTAPLVFGMTPNQAAAALGIPLIARSETRGSGLYYAFGNEGIPGFYPTDTVLALQFRRGRLTGWKQDWRLRRPWPF
jgi:hypothetical protein